MLELYKYQTHSNCPRCNTNNENIAHVLQCPNKQACIEWDKNMEALKQWMLQNKMPPNLTHIIISNTILSNTILSNINAWKYKAPHNQILPTSLILQKVILEQDWLGWKAFIEGFWTKKWNLAQKEYLYKINPPKSSELLLSKVQCRIWQIAWNMWSHRNNFWHDHLSSTPQTERLAHNKGDTTQMANRIEYIASYISTLV